MINKIINISSIVIIFCTIAVFLLTSNIFGTPISALEKISIIISEIAIIISSNNFIRTQKTSTMPILVFIRKSENDWQLQNVGSGPALNIIVSSKQNENKWDTVFFPPIAAGEKVELITVIKSNEYKAIYSDIYKNGYSSLCIKNIFEFHELKRLPKIIAYSTEWGRKKTREEMQKFF